MDFTIKTDDTGPALTVACTYSDGTVPDFTGAAGTFAMRNAVGTVIINDVAATMVAPLTGGTVAYNWVAGDTLTAGDYTGEFHVTLESGKRVTCPNSDYLRIRIYEDVP